MQNMYWIKYGIRGDYMFIDLQALVNNIVPFMGITVVFCLIADRFENKETVK